jgi:Ca-activated chloride channel family protein
MYRFVNPEYLILLLIIPLLAYWYIKFGREKTGTLKFSYLGIVKKLADSKKIRYRHSLFVFRLIGISLLIIALARPQSGSKSQEIETEGIDIVLVIDVSTSMLAEDLKPNRIQAAANVAESFIKGRKNDRIGLVIFARYSFTQCPLTLDYGVILNLLDKIKPAEENWDGTAIGMGLVNAINRIKDSKAKSKVIILLTDGRNNAGEINPLTAAQIAKAYNIRIYTIGAGQRGEALYPVDDPIFGKRYVRMPVEIDEDVMTKIAEMTGGAYFRATDEKKLAQIYKEIGEMEKTKIKVKEFTKYKELYIYFLTFGVLALILEVFLANTKFRKIP